MLQQQSEQRNTLTMLMTQVIQKSNDPYRSTVDIFVFVIVVEQGVPS